MLDQATIDLYLYSLRHQLQDAQTCQEKLPYPTGQLSPAEEHDLVNELIASTNRAGFILYQLFINGITQIDLGGIEGE